MPAATFRRSELGTHIRKWQASVWSTPGGGTDGEVDALAVFDDGSGAALYVGGYFTLAGGVPVTNIARWDGTAWTAVGSGIGGEVDALCAFDDGNGTALYAGGNFSLAGGVSANRIAKWDGSAWSALGSGLSGGGSTRVAALTVFDDGIGPALYVAGTFTSAGGVAATGIAKYDGSGWSALGSGVNGPGHAPYTTLFRSRSLPPAGWPRTPSRSGPIRWAAENRAFRSACP